MLKNLIFTVLFFINFQSYTQNDNYFIDINEVWYKFYQAFETLDYKLMADIHSKDLVRISGGKRISDYYTYINKYKSNFDNAIKEDVTNNISLRFFERIHNDSIASERGIYRLIRNKNKSDEQIYFGQFHVLFKKEDGQWKILMDYDSSEGNTIGENEFSKSNAITDFESFVKK